MSADCEDLKNPFPSCSLFFFLSILIMFFPPHTGLDYSFNLDDNEGVCDLFDVQILNYWRLKMFQRNPPPPPPFSFLNRSTPFTLKQAGTIWKTKHTNIASLLRPFALSRCKTSKNCSFICLEFCIFNLYMYAVDVFVCWAFCLFIGKMAATFRSKEKWK